MIVAFLFIVTLRAIAAKVLPRSQKPVWVTVLLFILLICGGFLTIHSTQSLSKAIHRKDWPVAPGKVIKAEAVVGGVIKPMVIYAYVANGSAYVDSTDLQVPGFGNRSKQYDVAKKLALEYPIGREIQVHYDPNDFTNSVLIVTPAWNIYGQTGLGMVLFTASLFFLALPRPKVLVRQN